MTEPSSAAIESHVLGADGGPKEPLTSADAVKRESGARGETLNGSDESVTTAADDQDARKEEEKGEDLEKDEEKEIEVRHRWTIFDPFNFKPPPPPPASMDDAETIRISQANWLSEFTFWWLQPLLVLGYKRELEATDLPKMDETREAGLLADKFEANFARRRKDVEDWNRGLDDGTYVPSTLQKMLWRVSSALGFSRADGRREVGMAMALSDTFFWSFWSAGIYKIIGDVAQTTSPLVMRQIIKLVQQSYAAKQAGEPLPGIGRGIGLAIGLFLMQLFMSVCQNNTFSRSGQVGILARAALIAALYRKAFRMSGKARVEHTNAQLTSHISTSMSRIEWSSTFFHFSYTCIIQLVEIVVILLCTIGATSLAGVGIVLLAIPVQTYAMRKLFQGRRKVQKHTDDRIKSISELLSGIRVVKFFAWEGPIVSKVGESRRRELGGIRRLLTIRAATQAMAMSLPVLSSVLVFAVYSLTGHAQNPAEIWTALSLLNLLRQPLMIPNSLSTMTDAYSAMKNLVPCFMADELPEELFVRDDKADLALQVKDATFVWESSAPPSTEKAGKGKGGKKAKKEREAKSEKGAIGTDEPSRVVDINLEVPRGQLLCVVGSVGRVAQNSHRCIGEMRRTSGNVVFGGSIAYCAQSAWIMNTTLRANILFGRPFDEERYWDCVRAACLLADLDQLPAGDQTEIGEKGITLSGGQRQRVAIARTLYYDADIVLLDDPLSAVDAHVGAHIFEHAIQGMLKDKTRILVTHAVHLLPKADAIIVMENGRVAERGSFDELMAAEGPFSRFAQEYGVAVAAEASRDVKATPAGGLAQSASKGKALSRPLMQKEEQASGSVGWNTWRSYFRAADGYYTVPLVLSSLVLMSAGQILSQFALTWWQEGKFGFGQNQFIGLYAGLGISSAIFTFVLGAATIWFGTTAARNLHHMALEKVTQAPMSFFDTTPLGRLMNRFSKDTDSIDNRLNDSLRMCLATIAQIGASIIVIAIVYPYFLIPTAVVLALFGMTSNFYRASARTIKRHDNVLRSFLYAWFGESLTGLSTIRAFGEKERFLRGNEKYTDLENRAWFLTVCNQRWLAIRVDAWGALLVLIVALVAVGERTTIPSSKTGLILAGTLAMQASIAMLIRQTAEVENNMSSIERFEWYANRLPQEAPAIIKETAPPSAWPEQGAVTFSDVEIRYRPDLPSVVRNFNLQIRGGEKVGVVGRTGAGKSTLTQALFRILETYKGTIEIDGLDISKLGLTQLRERLAIIPQEPLLFSGTLRSNLDPFGLYDDARLYDALRRSWLVDRTAGADGSGQISRFTLDTRVEDEGANMSLGERSLVSLARALVKDAKVIALDEATASVDLETDAKVQATIRSEFKDKTLLIIAHRISTIVGCDKILVMDRGEIQSFASPLELFDRGEGIFHSLCVQSSISREDIVKAQADR
ncbi:ABC transporter [Rhodotorula toruloides]|uniref:ABC transporter n=1 Tax=Rhodotorula toruloides TaxID=5286 RepID=A0A511KFU0_RHOTO|nr:ABC transporter [Rhodotorula toruloides]